jgi:hypothetical protein
LIVVSAEGDGAAFLAAIFFSDVGTGAATFDVDAFLAGLVATNEASTAAPAAFLAGTFLTAGDAAAGLGAGAFFAVTGVATTTGAGAGAFFAAGTAFLAGVFAATTAAEGVAALGAATVLVATAFFAVAMNTSPRRAACCTIHWFSGQWRWPGEVQHLTSLVYKPVWMAERDWATGFLRPLLARSIRCCPIGGINPKKVPRQIDIQ